MEITFDKVNYIYQQKTPFEFHALKDISFQIPKGSFTAIIGHTGSGKSTLIQHLNGLLRPTTGKVIVGEYELTHEKNKQIKELRKKVGMVFQYPEHQLFEETVRKDILFGPKNFGISVTDDDLEEVIDMVGISKNMLERSPFELSGGQMRRVAIASILISKPKVLVLDEPTAGLDPLGKFNMMELFRQLHKTRGQTTVLITHDMEDALKYADQIIVLNKGQIELVGSPSKVFKNNSSIKEIGLDLPEMIEFLSYLESKFEFNYSDNQFSIDQVAKSLSHWLREGGQNE